ncbi:MAG: ABC transporter substrate-binding protein [Candidatus Tectomicrobia bacterium]|uniref:ABC transporter substrate-binding protein n=1 Tax=Tectimicrobiota bacterium TaxID=2528274 RepID=A0A932MRC2_UNCTE|nr:ABC transporter substrate-binding protein [Candidatus Tectomicrobia bacterium]
MKAKCTAVVAVACLAFAAGAAQGAQKEVRIGFLAPMTGPNAQIGKDMSNGFMMYLEQIKYQMGPLKVKFILEDKESKPPLAVAKAQKLIQRDKVHMFLGGLLAPTGYALAPVADRFKVPYISPAPAGEDQTQRQRAKYYARLSFASGQCQHALGDWAYENGMRRVATVAADYAFGYESVGGFQRTFEEKGGKVVAKIWPKLFSVDYGPYLPLIPRDADAVYTLMVGPMSLAFPKQFKAAGFKMALLGGTTSADEFILPNMGDEAIGYVTASHYSAALDTPRNHAFVKEFQQRYGKMASYYTENSYTAAQAIHEALKMINYAPEKTDAFLAALKTIRMNAVRGPIYLDQHANPVQNCYIRKVERAAGDRNSLGVKANSLWNIVIKTYPAVSQFWTYKPEEFLKNPVYDKNFPPCKFCGTN